MLNVGARIKELREKMGLTQDELAARTGYKSRSSINKIEKGGNDLPQNKIIVFARALNTTPAYLLDLVDDSEIKNLTPTDDDRNEVYADIAKLSKSNVRLAGAYIKGLLANNEQDE